MPKIAIHHLAGSFSDRWIAWCQREGVPYELVNCLDSDILARLRSADALMWHWQLHNPAEQLCARHIIRSAEEMGLLVFPDTATCWHYDDKVAQKYLLEALGAPFIQTHVFYGLPDALRWLETAQLPLVFKLRKGAGSQNVNLVRTLPQAQALARRAFGSGFEPITSHRQDFAKRYRAVRKRRDLWGALRRLPGNLLSARRKNRLLGREGGYVYFQDFLPDNTHDIRVTVIGERAFAYTRNVRPGDFRASGSGAIVYDHERIPPECLRIAFDVARKARAQSMAFDFMLDRESRPWIGEVSYCYVPGLVYDCNGYWDRDLSFHADPLWPQDAIIKDLFDTLVKRAR